MPQSSEAVKRIEAALDLGFPLSDAVNRVLGRSLASFAREHGYRESEVSMCLRGYAGRVYGDLRDDLASELGIERQDLDRLITRSGGGERSSGGRDRSSDGRGPVENNHS